MSSIKNICRLSILSGFAWFTVFSAASANSAEKVSVFLLGGQSNMVGFGSQARELTAPYNAPLPQVRIWDLKKRQWTGLPLLAAVFGPEEQSIGAFGPEISFGHAMAGAFPKRDIRLIKYAANGTALHDDWAPGTGAQYIAFVDTVKAALQDLEANKIEYEIAGMLWLQGESDAVEKKGQDYQKNLMTLIKQIRTAFRTPKMPFVIARVRDHYGKGAQAKMVRDAQEFVAEKDTDVHWFDTDDCGPLIKGGHYTSKGLIEIGKRFADKLK